MGEDMRNVLIVECDIDWMVFLSNATVNADVHLRVYESADEAIKDLTNKKISKSSEFYIDISDKGGAKKFYDFLKGRKLGNIYFTCDNEEIKGKLEKKVGKGRVLLKEDLEYKLGLS